MPAGGTIVLTAPTGFEFSTTAPVTATITKTNAVTAACFTLSSSTVTPTASTITFTLSTRDGNSGSPLVTCRITFSNVRVRPTAVGTASGNITKAGTATIVGITNGSTNLGTLTEVTTVTNVSSPALDGTFTVGQ